MTGEKPVRTFSFLKQAKAKCAKLLQRTNFEFYPRAGILNCCNQALSLTTRVGMMVQVLINAQTAEVDFDAGNTLLVSRLARTLHNIVPVFDPCASKRVLISMRAMQVMVGLMSASIHLHKIKETHHV